VIPARVRYNKALPPYARLLYGDIASLCHQEGFCWANNKYFAKLYKVTETSISTWISALVEQGYIKIEVEKGKSRHIYIKENFKTSQRDSEEAIKESLRPLKGNFNYNNKDNNKDNNKNSNITAVLDSLSKNKRHQVEDIFEFWNSYKNPGKWQSHNKLTSDMVLAITENLKSYSIEDICQAINNYAKVLQDDKYYWTHIWPLSVFLTVKDGKYKDAPKKWIQKFLSENYVPQNWLKTKNGGFQNYSNKSSSQKQEELPPDPDPELTQLIMGKFKCRYNPGGDFPNFTAQKHFRLISTKAKKKYKLNSIGQKKNFVEEFFQIAQDTWSSKGDEVMPWDLSGNLMWDYKLPQYYQNVGIPESTIGEISENPLPNSELEVEKLPTFGDTLKHIEIGEGDNPELDCITSV